MTTLSPPAGYRESALGETRFVAHDEHHDAIRDILGKSPLHAWAANQSNARPLKGRETAWATRLGTGADVVVRHSRHGGLLGGLTGDLFVTPSRAPHELAMSLRLQAAKVPTPAVLAYAVYPALGPLCRADVVTALVDGADLPAAWAAAHSPAARDGIVDAVAVLIATMRVAGAHHPDLNVKNIHISEPGGSPLAWVLDVDRVGFGRAGDELIGRRNVHRLRRSLTKWRDRHGLDFSDAHWLRLVGGAGVRLGDELGST